MKVLLSMTTETGINRIFLTIVEKILFYYFANRNYGEDIKELHIHLYCLNRTREGYENHFLPRKPVYKQLLKFKPLRKGDDDILIHNLYTYDIDFDFQKAIENTMLQNLHQLNIEIEKSLVNFDNLPKKIKDFNVEDFKKDMAEICKDIYRSFPIK